VSATRTLRIAAVAAAAACSSGTDGGPRPDHLAVSPTSITMSVGAHRQLGVAVYDAHDNLIPEMPVTFRSGNTAVVTVSAYGNVVGVGLGVTTIVVSCSPASLTIPVTISNVPSRLEVSPLALVMTMGEARSLTVTAYDEVDHVIDGAVVTFRSTDTAVARVDATGLITGVAPGQTDVAAISGPVNAVVSVSVQAVAKLVISPADVFLTGSQTQQLTVTARDQHGNTVPTPALTFTSRDTGAVAVSGGGLVSRAGVGSAYVSVFGGGRRDSVPVTSVRARVTVDGQAFGAAAYSASRGYVTLATLAAVQQLDLADPGTLGTRVYTGGLASSIAVNAAGTRAYVGDQYGGGGVAVINTATNAVVSTIAITGDVLALHVVPGDSLLLVGTNTTRLYLVRLATGAVIDSFPVGQTNALAMRGDTTVFANNVTTATIAELDLRTRQVVRTLTVPGLPEDMVVSPDGGTLYVANEGLGAVQFWDLATGTQNGDGVSLPGGGGFGLARDPVTGLLYVSTGYIGARVHVVDPVARRILHVIATGVTPRRIAFSPDGSVGIVANEGGWVDYIK